MSLSHSQHPRNFDNDKIQCLGKRDKSFAGRIDAKAVDICAEINAKRDFYTTSSCSGRCFLYRGCGIKATANFERFRISHDIIRDCQRYFDLATLDIDPSGGADPIRTIGQFEHAELLLRQNDDPKTLGACHEDTKCDVQNSSSVSTEGSDFSDACVYSSSTDNEVRDHDPSKALIWLRFEPFILHVACRSLAASAELAAAARKGGFKNVGLTSWKDSKYIVAIWGDEGIDTPLGTSEGSMMLQLPTHDSNHGSDLAMWLAQQVNDRHERNWSKIHRFTQAVRNMPVLEIPNDENDNNDDTTHVTSDTCATSVPRSYDVIGDVAVLHVLPEGTTEDHQEVGNAIMKRNKSIKLVAVRTSNLEGSERAPGSNGMMIIAGPQRHPLVTTHTEYGIKCVVDLNHTFFTPRMGVERLRICQQVARGEHVLVLFAGVGMEALQIAGRTEALSVTAVEINPVAVECARRAHRLLSRNPSVKCVGAADRLHIVESDVLDFLPTVERHSVDRILAPRPKEGAFDCDLGNGDGGIRFLDALLLVLKRDGGECHWYEFAADHEYPACDRTRRMIEQTCQLHGLSVEILHVSKVGSVAMRQFRVCIDFKVYS